MRHPWQSAGVLAAVAVTAVVGLGATALPSHAGVAFSITLFGGSPDLVLIPGTGVYYADGYNCDVYRYNECNYAYSNGCWYRSNRYRGPWAAVSVSYVPSAVRSCYGGYQGGSYGDGCGGGYSGGRAYYGQPSYGYEYRAPRVVYYNNRSYNNRGYSNRNYSNRGYNNRNYSNRSYDNRSYNNRQVVRNFKGHRNNGWSQRNDGWSQRNNGWSQRNNDRGRHGGRWGDDGD